MMPRDPAATVALHTRLIRMATTSWRSAMFGTPVATSIRYRLRIGSFPLITAAYPLGGRSGAVMSFELAGYGNDPATKLHVALPETHEHAALGFVRRAECRRCWLRLVPSRGRSGK